MNVYRSFTKIIALIILLLALSYFYIILQGFANDLSNVLVGKETDIKTIEDYSGGTGIEYAVGFILFGLAYFMASFWNSKIIPLGQVPVKTVLKKQLFSIPIFLQIFVRVCIIAVSISILIPFGLIVFLGWGILLTNFIADVINSLFAILDKEIAGLAFVISIVGLMIKFAVDSRKELTRRFLIETTKSYEKDFMDSLEKTIMLIALFCYPLLLFLSGVHYYIALQAIQLYDLFNLSSLSSLILGLAVAEGIIFFISWLNKVRINNWKKYREKHKRKTKVEGT
jgi:hypothetical protein